MQPVMGAVLLGLTTALLVAAAVALVHGRRQHQGRPLPTSVTGPVLGLPLLALIAGAYGFIALLGATFNIGVATNLG